MLHLVIIYEVIFKGTFYVSLICGINSIFSPNIHLAWEMYGPLAPF